MTPAEFLTKMTDLRNQWRKASLSTTDQAELFRLCESFILEMDAALTLAGGHPEPPPPRVRP